MRQKSIMKNSKEALQIKIRFNKADLMKSTVVDES